jgi:Cu/Ag efflux protein CusF
MKAIVRSALVIALAGVVLGFAQTARAQDSAKKAEKPKEHQATGTITAVDVKAGTVTIEHKKESKTFSVAPDVKFGSEGEKVKMSIAELKVGDKVTIHYTEDGSKMIAHKIGHVDTSAKKAAPASAPAAPVAPATPATPTAPVTK